jgi:GntR family transcriptional regulator
MTFNDPYTQVRQIESAAMVAKTSPLNQRQPAAARSRKKTRESADLKIQEHALPAKKAGVPLYLHVASTLRTAIVRGIYPVGSRIPTEDDLCTRFEVSRHTIRDALRRLRADGLITSRQGGRPVVVPPSAQNAVRHWSAEINKDFFDHTMGTRLNVQSMEMVTITKTLAAQFDIGHGEEWLRVRGYRQVGENGAKVCWQEYLIDAEYAAVGRLLHRHVGPLVLLIEDLFSEKIIEFHYSLSAVPMPAEQAATFQVASESPALRIATRCKTSSEKLALISISLQPGNDAYSIRLQDREKTLP